MIVTSSARICLAFIASTTLALAACGGDPPPPPATPSPPAVEPPKPRAPELASTATAPPPKPEVAWTTVVDFAALPPARAAKPEDKKLLALVTDIKKTHKECAASTPTITSQTASQGAFTAKGTKETALIVEWDCNAPKSKAPAPALVFRRLVVVGGEKGDKVTREVEVPERLIGAMTDVDSDGDNELILVNGSGLLNARLLELADAPAGQLALIFAWTSLGSSDCTGGEQDAPKLLYRVTDSTEFKAERAKKACSATPPPAPPKK